MISHVQLDENDEFLRFISNDAPIVWDENNYCTVTALETDGKAEEFKVFPLYNPGKPEYDEHTQELQEVNPVNIDGLWTQQWVVVDLTTEQIKTKRFEADKTRYTKRALVKDELIAYMTADNMSRVRDGVWSVPDLTGLLDDPAIVAANTFMSTLSYELAANAIMGATSPLMTTEIKMDWVGKLQSHFYL